MRLINVKSLKLEEFHHNIPPYAILSHTWGHEEVTFEEYLLVIDPYSNPGTHIRVSAIKKKAGFAKIIGACRRAHDDKLGYLWCDTNCIDKRSSAELSEAINSMYAWYHNSAVCYAYLADVAFFDTTNRGAEEFRNTRWFTRGWTLQELLAPKEVLFFNKGWEPIAARRHLAEIIRDITRIHRGALENRNSIPTYSIAQRMSWAAGRQTSRQEDIAYCLLGIFGINMPLLYGEGLNAFTRLQEEIIKVSDDQSILAWDFLGNSQQPLTGLLASSPREFASCGSIVREMSITRWPYATTNLGISLQLPVIETSMNRTILVSLNCSSELQLQGFSSCNVRQATKLSGRRFPVWIWLRSTGHNIYARSPGPVSRTSLTGLYSDVVDCVVTKLFGITSASRIGPGISSIHPLIQSNSVEYTGFHITISFGRIRPRTGILEKAFQPGDFSVNQLKPRGSPALSHEIISAGSYIVVLSIAWERLQQPCHYRYAIFKSLNKSTIRVMSVNNWDVLFRTPQNPACGQAQVSGRIDYIYDRIQKLSHQPTTTSGEDMPFVKIEKDLWQDLYGKVKVVANLTFQEVTSLQHAS